MIVALAPLTEYLLRLGDADLILAQRLGELAGKGPIVEEDLAASNVALDLLGQARNWLTYAGECEGAGRTEDALAFFRAPNAFRNPLLVEQPNGDFAQTIGRQFLFDTWHFFMLQALASSSADERVVGIAAKGVREVAYHVRRSSDWVIRLGDGTAESHARMQRAIDELWTYTGELVTGDAVDEAMIARGIGPDPESLREPWREHVAATLREATLAMPADGFMRTGGKNGRHGETLSYLLAEMQSVRRSIPGDTW